MSRDEIVALVLIGSFACWATVHLVIAAKLLSAPPRWRGLMALIVPPLAPYWAARTARPWLALAWGVACITWLFVRMLLVT
jgi:hypothetical protein